MGKRERTTLIATALILTMMLFVHASMVLPQSAKPDMRFAAEINPPASQAALGA